MINTIQSVLNQILLDHPPKSILCVGREVREAIKIYSAKHPACCIFQLDVTHIDEQHAMQILADKAAFDFGIVANSIEYLDKSSAEHLLARLRDMHTKRLLVVVPIGDEWTNHASHWEETELLAMGFVIKANLTVDQKPVHVYAFDIASYKTTPEWLNNKYWANPDLWDKHWW